MIEHLGVPMYHLLTKLRWLMNLILLGAVSHSPHFTFQVITSTAPPPMRVAFYKSRKGLDQFPEKRRLIKLHKEYTLENIYISVQLHITGSKASAYK